ncbi:MAG: response regulator [Thermodesulfobacteriota bacterium]|nr:response regulator [Thermodesulfobacteriota bacterium]
MPLKYKHSLLFVDDEGPITKALQRLFRKERYDIYTAASGREGLERLKEVGKPFSLIISDQRMPEMSGAQFLEKARGIFPQAIRILLTGYSDMDAIVEAINKGGIHRYFTKPWNDDDLVLQVRQSLEQYELALENRRLLALTRTQNKELKGLNNRLEEKVAERTREVMEKNDALSSLNRQLESSLYNTVRAFASLVEMLTPALAGHGRRVGAVSREIAQELRLPEKEVNEIEIAGLLHDIGKLGFPERLLAYSEKTWTDQEKVLFRKHPEQGEAAVQFIDNLDHVGMMIRNHHEQYDGHGYPDRLTEEQIPLGSRIIAAADAYDKIVKLKILDDDTQKVACDGKPLTHKEVTEEVLQRAAMLHLKDQAFTLYDPDIVKVFLDMLKRDGLRYGKEKELSLDQVEAGMVLSQSIHTSSGRFLISKNTTLTHALIAKLKSIHSIEPVTELVRVEVT